MIRSIPAILLAALLFTGRALGAPADAECLNCHDKSKGGEAAEKAGLDMAVVAKSAHKKQSCVDCHTDAKGDGCKKGLANVSCASCHEKEQKAFNASTHAKARTPAGAAAVSCTNCHGTHETLSKKDPKSSVYPTEQPKTCAKCHDPADKREQKGEKRTGFRLKDYLESAHWLGMTKDGLVVSASCTSCHGGHEMRDTSDSKSKVARMQLAETCGKCHEGMREDYFAGAHGKALQKGSADTPICTDCHGDHGIKDHEDPKSSVFATTISKVTCPQCHEGEYINRRYGIPRGQVKTYAETFHGLADKAGDATVANCASCHGAHKILHSSDPQSLVNPANLPKTCGECHPGAGPNFAKGSAHTPEKAEGGAALYWIKWIYIVIIAGTLGGMFLHNVLDYVATLRERYRQSKREKRYERFTVNERIQHLILVITFGVLVFSGFALKYPDAFWVKPVMHSQFAFLARGHAHRVAAVIMTLASFYHIYYLAFTKRGREQIKAMMPGKKDALDVYHQMRYYVGLDKKPAKFGRYTYGEKVEYLALIWGSIVMVVTGTILWFEEPALAWMPKWGWDVAELVHLMEAWLATMAVLVWHFYAVIFRPSGHGVSLVMAHGKLTEEEMHHEHAAELEALPASAAIQPTEEQEETSTEEPHGKGTSLQTV